MQNFVQKPKLKFTKVKNLSSYLLNNTLQKNSAKKNFFGKAWWISALWFDFKIKRIKQNLFWYFCLKICCLNQHSFDVVKYNRSDIVGSQGFL